LQETSRASPVPGGTLYLSWRVTETTDRADQVDASGRRYACFPAALVTDALNGMRIVRLEQRTSRSSGKPIAITVARENN